VLKGDSNPVYSL